MQLSTHNEQISGVYTDTFKFLLVKLILSCFKTLQGKKMLLGRHNVVIVSKMVL